MTPAAGASESGSPSEDLPPPGRPAAHADPDGGSLAGRRIVLGVTGGIAAYKAVEVCRRLMDAGAFVSPVLTDGALHFVGETTFSALASEPVQRSLWTESDPIPHTRLGQGADAVVVVPATARLLADYASGRSHDLLTATLLATRAPVVVCPAMHTEMWEHPAVQANVDLLRRRGVVIVDPEEGRLAGGDVGAGRLAAPEVVLAAVTALFADTRSFADAGSSATPRGGVGGERAPTGELAGWTVVVTAGGTREPIDPVRFIGNRSSGKQGHAIAEEAQARGASVTLITTSSLPSSPAIVRLPVETAAQMQGEVARVAAAADVVVMAAAVADFRPAAPAPGKLKKSDGVPQVLLEPTPDILAGLGAVKPPSQILVGFAAETSDLEANARSKLERKNLDLLVANDVVAPGAGFEHDTNAVVILGADDSERRVSLRAKSEVAAVLWDRIVEWRRSHPR